MNIMNIGIATIAYTCHTYMHMHTHMHTHTHAHKHTHIYTHIHTHTHTHTHTQFRDPSVTSECLFSLINGDDMYMTYQEMSTVSGPAWVFSKIYLYVFIALFIYVVLSVFISLISDTYETLHVSLVGPHVTVYCEFQEMRKNAH